MDTRDIKKELIERYKYIYKNAGFIILPFIDFKKENGNYTLNCKFNNHMCYLIESFLLYDRPYKKTTLYKTIEDIKLDRDYYDKFIKGKVDEFYLYCETLDKDNDNDNNSNIRYVNYLLDIVRFYTDKGLRSRDFIDKKLRVLDEYYRINRFNPEKTFSSGFRVNVSDKNLNNLEEEFSYSIKLPNIYAGVGTSRCDFIDFVSDFRNHHYRNLSLLTEEEKLDMFKELEPNKYDKYEKNVKVYKR